jgi:hypothetical protein
MGSLQIESSLVTILGAEVNKIVIPRFHVYKIHGTYWVLIL